MDYQYFQFVKLFFVFSSLCEIASADFTNSCNCNFLFITGHFDISLKNEEKIYNYKRKCRKINFD